LVLLVQAAQLGDSEAFGLLVARYETAVYATAMRRLGNHAEAQELCQEVFVRALEKLHQLKTPEAFGGWLRSITIRMAINRSVRTGSLARANSEVIEAAYVEHETPLQRVLDHEQRLQVREGLGRLGELDRQTLTAFYVEGHSLIEMSRNFRSPVGTIKRRLHVARKRLAKELAELAA
jgi:RNA polymerase sigma-70 factor (ECF subfamily)